jgi:hypothetical protein
MFGVMKPSYVGRGAGWEGGALRERRFVQEETDARSFAERDQPLDFRVDSVYQCVDVAITEGVRLKFTGIVGMTRHMIGAY